MSSAWIKKIKAEVRGAVRTDEMLKNYTTMRIGGPADVFIEPHNTTDLERIVLFAKDRKVPLKIIGAGSNILFSDKGYQGIVVWLKSEFFRNIEIKGETVRAGAGAKLSELISRTAAAGLSGMEFLCGIPGTIGGAVMTNAGARIPDETKFLDIAELVEEVKVLNSYGNVQTLGRDELMFSYRWSSLSGSIILEACLKLCKNEHDQIRVLQKKFKNHRRSTQPVNTLNAGCVFRNPSSDLPSGKLIDLCGLKGKQIGHARISDEHANFIVNLGQAGSGDVLDLINLVQEKVKHKFDIELEPEIEIIK